jgi:hypothetical protein
MSKSKGWGGLSAVHCADIVAHSHLAKIFGRAVDIKKWFGINELADGRTRMKTVGK